METINLSKIHNRGSLKSKLKAGKILARCTGYYTDDYAWDNSVNFGIQNEYIPAVYALSFWKWLEAQTESVKNKMKRLEDYQEEERNRKEVLALYHEYTKECNPNKGTLFTSDDLESSSGGIWYDSRDNTYTLSIHSNLTYKLKLID